MFTSCYARLKQLPPELVPVSISRGRPRWFKGRVLELLAPTWAMLKMSCEEYDRHFDAILRDLDPNKIAEQLGENAVMLCWEAPNIKCHRRRVAEWLEESLGIEVTEVGFTRAEVLAYSVMPDKAEAKTKAPKAAKPPRSTQESQDLLF